MKISVLTPTADRPIAFALCEEMMRRQTVQPFEWIVADGGQTPVTCTMGQRHIHIGRPPGPANFAHNLLNGIAAAKGGVLIIVEDDDCYLPRHIETMAAVADRGYRLIGTEDIQRYYNVAHRVWRVFNNVGSSLCQTGIRRELFPLFKKTVQDCLGRNAYGIDTNLWRAAGVNEWGFTREMTVVGIKGIPGRVGLGVGHRPDARWTRDPDLAKLREWIGADAENYAGFFPPAAATSSASLTSSTM